MHRPKRFATSRKHQCLRNMAKRKNATPKTTCKYNIQDGSKW